MSSRAQLTMPRTPDWNSTISSAVCACIHISLDHWGLLNERLRIAIALTLNIAQTVDTAAAKFASAWQVWKPGLIRRWTHRAIPSPMERTRPVSAVAVSALLPEILCSRMDETSDAAAFAVSPRH